ncbi:TIGR02444 family protein [Amphritea sp.]|uniref:TIGR02444 family protein n=1 Tax=Amphritea sp. TaxID=1872502 RepID=UPI003A91E938
MLDNNVFWNYAVQIYSVPDVAALCLTLQNRYQLSVNYLLFGLWLAHEGRYLPADLSDQKVCQWRKTMLEPLRQLRFTLRETKQSGEEYCCYEALKQAELAAEKVEIGLLYELRERCPEADLASGEDAWKKLSYCNLCVAATSVTKSAAAEFDKDEDLQALLAHLGDKATSAVVIS